MLSKWLLGWAVPALLVALLACAGRGEAQPQLPAADMPVLVPWGEREEAHYRILRGDRLSGSAVLRVERRGDAYVLTQDFRSADQPLRDTVTVTVDAATLKPRTVERVIAREGEGERRCQAQYGPDRVVVRQESEGESRSDELPLPPHAYDSWADIFLWRALPLDRTYRGAYNDVGTCLLRKPGHALMALEVITMEPVVVPAGTFQAWRLEARSGGHRQIVWIGNSPQRPIVRYDNGTHIFELESIR
ncbi:MAG TPA: DUF3108 domain-containing protein [Dehalococcoidia bacterium]|nr:DUF3108 domain-containing protein [Dehalococcoidia bacterium]